MKAFLLNVIKKRYKMTDLMVSFGDEIISHVHLD